MRPETERLNPLNEARLGEMEHHLGTHGASLDERLRAIANTLNAILPGGTYDYKVSVLWDEYLEAYGG